MQAAQALEPAALVPLQLLAPGGHVVLVGDPKQLPPTVLSRAAEASNLAQSLFERLQQVCCFLLLLDRILAQQLATIKHCLEVTKFYIKIRVLNTRVPVATMAIMAGRQYVDMTR